MTNLFSGNPTFAQGRGRVRDWLNWNMPLLTGVEADYGGSPTGTPGQGGSNYWVEALTGSTAANQADQASAAAHSGGWQGWLADSLKNANASQRAAGTSDWNPFGWVNTETGTRTNFDPNTPFLKLSDLRNTSGFTDPSGSNYTVEGDFQSRKYDPAAALAAATAANYMPPSSANWNNYANEASEAGNAAAATAASSGAVTNHADGSIQTNNVALPYNTTGLNSGTDVTAGTTGGNNNIATGAPSVDDIKNYLGSAYQLYLNRDPVYNDDFTDTADYWIKQVQDRFANNEFGGENDTWQDWLSKSIRGGTEYTNKFTTGDGNGNENEPIDTSQFLTSDALNEWWEALDKSAFMGNQEEESGGMDDFMQFMMFMSMMRPQGMGGGSQYGYGGMNPGGVQSAYNPMDDLQGMMDAFNTFKGGTTLNTGTT